MSILRKIYHDFYYSLITHLRFPVRPCIRQRQCYITPQHLYQWFLVCIHFLLLGYLWIVPQVLCDKIFYYFVATYYDYLPYLYIIIPTNFKIFLQVLGQAMMGFNGQDQEISFICYIIDILIATTDGLEVILIGCLAPL